MKKRMIIMLVCVGVLFGGILIYKIIVNMMVARFLKANQNPPVTVSTMKVGYAKWQPQLTATGSLRAIRGVNVTTELAGMVQKIYFKPGAAVKQGEVLVQLNADSDLAQLRSLKANAELARITLARDQAQYKIQAVSKATLDQDVANLKSLKAQVAEQEAIVQKKTITAPFDGKLGISQVNPGQYVNPGDAVVTLQSLDPIYVDFYLPQQTLKDLRLQQETIVTTDTYPDRKYTGKITTINPIVDPVTRNITVEGTINNPKNDLLPGMFVRVGVIISDPLTYLTIPQTAVTYNPYGEIVYVVRESKDEKDQDGKPQLIANQAFVKTGTTRGNQVTILEGLKAGQVIVTSGQLKLKNGSRIKVNNSVQPPNDPNPTLPNEH